MLQLFMIYRFHNRLTTRLSNNHNNNKNNGNNIVLKIQRRANLLCHTLIVVYTFSDWFHAYGASDKKDIDGGWLVSGGITFVFRVSADIFYFLASLNLYFILIYRLIRTFKSTIYSISNLTCVLISVVIVLQTLGFVAYVILMFECENASINQHMSQDQRAQCQRVLGGIAALHMCFDYILTSYILFLFINKLRLLLVDMAVSDLSYVVSLRNNNSAAAAKKSNDDSHAKMSGDINCNNSIKMNTNSNNNSNGAQKLFYGISKQNVIGLWILIVGQLFFTLQFVFNLVSVRPKNIRRFMAIVYCCRSLQGLYIMFFLDLSFAYSDPLYRRLCVTCHQCVFACHFWSLQKQIVAVVSKDSSSKPKRNRQYHEMTQSSGDLSRDTTVLSTSTLKAESTMSNQTSLSDYRGRLLADFREMRPADFNEFSSKSIQSLAATNPSSPS